MLTFSPTFILFFHTEFIRLARPEDISQAGLLSAARNVEAAFIEEVAGQRVNLAAFERFSKIMTTIIAGHGLSRNFKNTITTITRTAALVADMSVRRALACLDSLTRPRAHYYVCPVWVIMDAFDALHAVKLVGDLPQRFVGANFGCLAAQLLGKLIPFYNAYRLPYGTWYENHGAHEVLCSGAWMFGVAARALPHTPRWLRGLRLCFCATGCAYLVPVAPPKPKNPSSSPTSSDKKLKASSKCVEGAQKAVPAVPAAALRGKEATKIVADAEAEDGALISAVEENAVVVEVKAQAELVPAAPCMEPIMAPELPSNEAPVVTEADISLSSDVEAEEQTEDAMPTVEDTQTPVEVQAVPVAAALATLKVSAMEVQPAVAAVVDAAPSVEAPAQMDDLAAHMDGLASLLKGMFPQATVRTAPAPQTGSDLPVAQAAPAGQASDGSMAGLVSLLKGVFPDATVHVASPKAADAVTSEAQPSLPAPSSTGLVDHLKKTFPGATVKTAPAAKGPATAPTPAVDVTLPQGSSSSSSSSSCPAGSGGMASLVGMLKAIAPQATVTVGPARPSEQAALSENTSSHACVAVEPPSGPIEELALKPLPTLAIATGRRWADIVEEEEEEMDATPLASGATSGAATPRSEAGSVLPLQQHLNWQQQGFAARKPGRRGRGQSGSGHGRSRFAQEAGTRL